MCHKKTSKFPTGSNSNWPVHQKKITRGLSFRNYKVEGLYYPCKSLLDMCLAYKIKFKPFVYLTRVYKIHFHKFQVTNFCFFRISYYF